MFANNILSATYDQHLLVTGLRYESIKRLFRATLGDWRNSLRSVEPALSLRLDFVFGVETFHKNNTVLALNHPKRVLYFVGKLVVVYNPALNTQAFYRGHKYRVTCLVLLEQAKAASGEAAYAPLINIWNVITLETLRVVQSRHRWGILELAVEANVLLSYGFREKRGEEDEDNPLYSYQLHDTETGYSIAYGLEKNFVYAIKLNPSNHLRFVTCTEGKVTFWAVTANAITRQNVCLLQDTPTACAFYPPLRGTPPDLLVGTRSGAVGMVVR
jgi:hypothetical protein